MKNRAQKLCALVALFASAIAIASPVHAQEGKSKGKPIGYGGPRVELQPFLVPTRTPDGRMMNEVLTVRLVLDAGEKQRQGCFMAPIVHERFLMYLYKANLTSADFVGQRRDVLMKNLLEVAIKATTKGYYSGVEAVDDSSPPLMQDPISLSMSKQCK